ncbi:hypothetical protein A3305_01375 [Rickettsia amblyommatis]|uniref:Uncharacterized protein n=1 Tax=Rickettsia amblyommatis (strain GAT-30V) TaxID=1105111 RepID=H8K2W0_RICAG|nr:ankyrin repeat domain-containing protein [Rickettsia amblyommatis]AFC70228.1 hypothetical protein MCE_07220 [Rickettsia amblyommatis str. GAT-30V]ALA62183.1 hypothetical protein AL573_06550 [Rickettsia amblyommatis]ARD87245.1 hypothetical protein A3305_01375 [Rickettsia amblyommatis]KJV88953.1 ankyrin repeat family protein [Rickettsia amblyommatis str. Darkwater]
MEEQEKQQQNLKLDELKYNQLILVIKESKEEAENLVKELNGDTLNKIDDNGDTVLTLAAYKGLDKVCELLISKMSNQAISTINRNGKTALTYTASKGLSKVCM